MSEHPGLPPQTPQGTGLPGISNPIYTFPDKTSSHTKATTAAILAIIIGSSRFTEILKDFSISMEAYLWGVGEYDSEDGVYGGGEGCVRAAVVGVEDTPGLQLRNEFVL